MGTLLRGPAKKIRSFLPLSRLQCDGLPEIHGDSLNSMRQKRVSNFHISHTQK